MKSSVLVGALLTSAAFAVQADDARVQTTSLTVEESLAAIELINVTADKPQDVDAAAATDPEVVEILAAAEAAE